MKQSERIYGNPPGIGCSVSRMDAKTKVTGQEVYAADHYPNGCLWAGVKRSSQTHARLIEVDLEVARQLPGVVAVLTSRDIEGSNRLGIFEKDQPVLAEDIVRYCGEAIALVVAESKDALEQALKAIRIEYEKLEAVLDLHLALQPESPVLHSGRADGNVLLRDEICCGRGAAALSECAFSVDVSVEVNWQDHAFLETEAGMAQVEEDGTISLVVATQTPFRDRLELGEALKVIPQKLHIMAPYLGGAFGGKDGITVQGFLVLAALHAGGRPVRMQYTREERFVAGTKRHPAQMNYRLGCDREGQLQALDCELLFDTGAYAAMGAEVFALAMEHAGGPYGIPNSRISGAVVYTNNPLASAFRGFGVPQAAAGIEQAMDELAKRAGFDPLEFRLRNAVQRGGITPAGVRLSQSVGLTECLKKLAAHPLWTQRQAWREEAPAFKRRGVGIAACYHAVGFGPIIPDYANAKLELKANGRLRVYAGVADMGQGNASTYLQIAGHLLSQDMEEMELVLPDTSQTLPSCSSSASRTTFTYGKALEGAAAILKERLLARAVMLFTFQFLEQVHVDDLLLCPGKIIHQPSGREVPLALLAGFMDPSERTVTYSYTCPVNKQVPETGKKLRKHGFPHRVFAYGAQLVRLEVDTLSGEVTVCDFLNCIDAGNVLNPQVFEQQIQGGAAQGIGYALFEDFVLQAGEVRTRDFSTYILPTALDIPALETVTANIYEDDGPFGMKGAGEISIDGVLPAIANGLASITETRLVQGTLTGEKVLAALRQAGLEAVR